MVLQEILAELESLVRDNRYDSALAACELALAGDVSQPDQARLLLWKARILVTRDGQWGGPAIACLKAALKLVRSQPELKARVLATFTAAYAAVGAVNQCQEYRRAFVELQQKAKTPEVDQFYPHVEYNFGLACHQAELLGAAEEAYLLALAAYVGRRDPGLEPFIADVKMNLIDVLQELDQHEQAYYFLLDVEKLLPEATFGAISRLRRAIHAIYRGDLTAATLLVESGLDHPSCDARTRAALMLTMAKILKTQGQAGEAHDLALEAMQVAAGAKSSHLCHRVSRFLDTISRGE